MCPVLPGSGASGNRLPILRLSDSRPVTPRNFARKSNPVRSVAASDQRPTDVCSASKFITVAAIVRALPGGCGHTPADTRPALPRASQRRVSVFLKGVLSARPARQHAAVSSCSEQPRRGTGNAGLLFENVGAAAADYPQRSVLSEAATRAKVNAATAPDEARGIGPGGEQKRGELGAHRAVCGDRNPVLSELALEALSLAWADTFPSSHGPSSGAAPVQAARGVSAP